MNRERQQPIIQVGWKTRIAIAGLAVSMAGCGGAAEGSRTASQDASPTPTTDGSATDTAAAMTTMDGGPAVNNAAASAVSSDAGGGAEADFGAGISDFALDRNVVDDSPAINPPTIGNDGYLTVDSGSSLFFGYVASATGGSSSSITLTYGSTAFCASGSVASNGAYASWAEAGFNVNQPKSPTGGMARALSLPGSSMILSFENLAGSPLRVVLIDSSFNAWCYTLTQTAGPVAIAMSSFNTQCWDNSGQSFQPGTDIQAFQLAVPGSDPTTTPFNFCFLGVTIQ